MKSLRAPDVKRLTQLEMLAAKGSPPNPLLRFIEVLRWRGGAPVNGNVEIGYGVAKLARGRGIATLAVEQLLALATASGVVREVVAHILPDNLASSKGVPGLGSQWGALLLMEMGRRLCAGRSWSQPNKFIQATPASRLGLIAGVRPMRSFTTLAALISALAAGTPSRDSSTEDFGAAFEKMQASPEFLASRAHSDLQIVEEFRSDGDVAEESRAIPCTVWEMHKAGWYVLPSTSRLAATGTTYSSPQWDGMDRVAVTLGPAEGTADAKYVFRALDGEWRLARIEIYSYLAPAATMPSAPCTPGNWPNSSFKPKPLRGAA